MRQSLPEDSARRRRNYVGDPAPKSGDPVRAVDALGVQACSPGPPAVVDLGALKESGRMPAKWPSWWRLLPPAGGPIGGKIRCGLGRVWWWGHGIGLKLRDGDLKLRRGWCGAAHLEEGGIIGGRDLAKTRENDTLSLVHECPDSEVPEGGGMVWRTRQSGSG